MDGKKILFFRFLSFTKNFSENKADFCMHWVLAARFTCANFVTDRKEKAGIFMRFPVRLAMHRNVNSI